MALINIKRDVFLNLDNVVTLCMDKSEHKLSILTSCGKTIELENIPQSVMDQISIGSKNGLY